MGKASHTRLKKLNHVRGLNMARRTKYGASPTVLHFLRNTEMEIVNMIDDRAKEKRKAYGPAIRINKNTLKRKPIHV